NRRHHLCVGLPCIHDNHEDDDSAAGLQHPAQHRPDRNCDPDPQLPRHRGAVRGDGAQCLPAASDAATGPRRQEIGQQRPVDGLA
ncbi:hypothetical protein ABTC43_19650, partial [Acinetobacter baumannii]